MESHFSPFCEKISQYCNRVVLRYPMKIRQVKSSLRKHTKPYDVDRETSIDWGSSKGDSLHGNLNSNSVSGYIARGAQTSKEGLACEVTAGSGPVPINSTRSNLEGTLEELLTNFRRLNGTKEQPFNLPRKYS